MRPLAKILLAGTCVATLASAANAQDSEVVNLQDLQGDVFAAQQLNVIDPAEGVVATAEANGNGISAAAEGANLGFRSEQNVDGKVSADTDVEVHGWTPETVASASAAGNTGEAFVIDGGELTGDARQVIGENGAVTAVTRVRAQLSSSGDTSADSTALGNTHSWAAGSGGYASSKTVQTQQGVVRADTEASLWHVKGRAALTSMASSNYVTHAGTGASGDVSVVQTTTGETVATSTGEVQSGALVDSTATASANSITAASESIELAVAAKQANEGYVRAESYLYVQDFGGVTSSASGVGNSLTAELSGDYLTIDADQFNGGFIDVEATFEAGDGYDADVSAMAFGNTVTGSVCGECDGHLTVDNRQTNDGNVSAQARLSIGSSRRVTSTASAVGNNAAYYVTTPNR